MSESWQPLVVMVAPNGTRRTKDDHPAIPLTAEELAAEARLCLEAGAAAIHLHIRDRQGQHLLDADGYREAMRAVEKTVGEHLLIQITTEAVGRYQPEEQMQLVRDLRPEAASVAIRELVEDSTAAEEPGEFFHWCHNEGIGLQYILYSCEDIQAMADLCRQGLIPQDDPSVLLVLGRYHPDQRSTPRDLLPLLRSKPSNWRWMMCAFGARENACAMTAAALDGHVRVGFENNLWLADGRQAPNNAALVTQVRTGADVLGRPLGDAATARQLLGTAR